MVKKPTVLLVLAACGPNEDNWGEKSAKAQCDFAKRCDAANFWYTWDDEKACIDAAVAAYDASKADLASCTFDKDAAKACLKALDQSCKEIGREYDSLVPPCFEVWDCGGAVDSTDTAGTTAGTTPGT